MTPPTLEEQLAASIEWAKKRKAETQRQREEVITMRGKVEFETNIWETIALRYPDGVNAKNQYGDYVRFQTVDNRTLFIAPEGAAKIRALSLNPGQPIAIRKHEVKDGGQANVIWEVRKVGEQSNGTFAVKKETASVPPPAAPAATPAVTPAPQRQQNGTNSNGHCAQGPAAAPPKTKLEDALKTVVAACHSAREYAKSIGYEAMPPFTSEDIRTMANTLMIQQGGAR